MTTPPPTLAQALEAARRRGLERLDAQILLLHVLGRSPHDRAWLLAHDDARLDAATLRAFDDLCTRRAAGEPVAYLLGRKEFFGLDLAVDRRVLVPRPDTESLVEWALELLDGTPAPRILDLGTGSGAIALALLSRRPDAHVEATDLSADALAVSRGNAERLGLPLQLRQAAWLDGAGDGWSLIASNPPYIREGDPHLPALAHEPRTALTAGEDGLCDIRTIVGQALPCLAPGGWLLLEHGWDQAEVVRALLEESGFTRVGSRRDLAGIERASGGQRPGA
jgi:release factor glutamine methyltransferase